MCYSKVSLEYLNILSSAWSSLFKLQIDFPFILSNAMNNLHCEFNLIQNYLENSDIPRSVFNKHISESV